MVVENGGCAIIFDHLTTSSGSLGAFQRQQWCHVVSKVSTGNPEHQHAHRAAREGGEWAIRDVSRFR